MSVTLSVKTGKKFSTGLSLVILICFLEIHEQTSIQPMPPSTTNEPKKFCSNPVWQTKDFIGVPYLNMGEGFS